ncbi:YadA family autotransporter adhesin [Burkholderia stabilis]|uniref:Adhesin n=1 Tax=Burkholderia stabilis TaxID=95485 RepID=A0AAJ5T7S1_9BURK|nr:ESPR-type extended signal peptide-containing protein [Burkholderia stabilis]VBB15632.1 putative Adhesin [Burkholderia stabilis]
MNKTYRNIWNAATGTWTAVAETAKSHSKGSARAARQAVVALALGGAAASGAFAADACTTVNGISGSLDEAGVCQAPVAAKGARSVGTMAAIDDTYIKIDPTSNTTAAQAGGSALAIGANAQGTGISATVTGNNTVASSRNSSAFGFGAQAIGGTGTTTGAATAIGAYANAAGYHSSALGVSATASGSESVALGVSSVADRDNSVSIGSAGNERQLTNLRAGTQGTDAVNVAQLTPVVNALGGGATINATTGAVTGPTYTLANGGTQTTVGGALGALDGAMTTANGNIAKNTADITTINNKLGTAVSDEYVKINPSTATAAVAAGGAMAIGGNAQATDGGATAIGNDALASGRNSAALGFNASAAGAAGTALGAYANAAGYHGIAIGVAASATGSEAIAIGASSLADRDNSVSIGSAGNERQLTNLRAGTQDTDAVNVSQLKPAVEALGGGATIDATTGAVTGPTYALANGGTQTTVGGALGALDGAMTTANGNIAKNTADIAQNTADITTINNKLGAAISDDYFKVDTSSSTAAAQAGGSAIAVGANAQGTGGGATAVGNDTLASASNSAAFGRSATASGGAATAIGAYASATGYHASAFGVDAIASGSESVALGVNSVADRDNSVSIGAAGNERQLTNLRAGTQDTDAVNVSQLKPVVDALGGGAAIDPTTGAVTGPTYALANGGTQTTVGGAFSALDGELTTAKGDIAKNASDITNINDQLSDLSNGTIGLVQQSGADADITVGAGTKGAAVNFAGMDGDRKLTGVAAGEVSAASNEAINGSQLHGVADSVASAIGGGATVNPDGSITAPTFTIGDGNGGSTTVHNMGDVVTNLDGRVTSNEGDIAKLSDQIGSGTVGLVQQAGADADITVGAGTRGAAVSFTGMDGDRKLTGVAAGEVSAASNEAVNGSQLHGVADSVASAIGGGATVNPDGSITAPTFTVGDGNGGTTTVHNMGDVVTNVDGRVTKNESAITNLGDQLASGQIGLVQQDPTTGAITVGANAGGSTVNFASGGNSRTLSGVANGVNDDDAVTIAQLKATGLIDYTGKEIAAVTYDDITLGSVTFGGTGGTVLHNVGAGLIASGSMDAVNGGQLYDLQQQFAQQYDQLSGQMGDLTDRIGELETGGGSGGGSGGDLGPGTGTGGDGSLVIGDGSNASGENSSAVGQGSAATGDNSSAVGQGAVASGENSSAAGQGAVASGDNGSAFGQGSAASGSNGTAIGQGSAASGSNGTAVGQGSVASGSDSTAIGQGSSATGNGSVAIGAGSVADRDNSVSVGSAGNERQITNVAAGTADTDAVNVGQMNQRFGETNRMINDVAKNAYAGVAAAMAMPNLTPSQPGKTVVAVGAANYKSGSAVAAGATYRTRDGKWLMNGAVSVTSTGDAGVRAQVGYEF